MVAVLIFNHVYWFWKKTLLENWLPWQQRNVYLQFFNLKILLIPSYEKSPSFKVIACSVLEFWAIYLAGGGKHPPPGANKVKDKQLKNSKDWRWCNKRIFGGKADFRWASTSCYWCPSNCVVPTKYVNRSKTANIHHKIGHEIRRLLLANE